MLSIIIGRILTAFIENEYLFYGLTISKCASSIIELCKAYEMFHGKQGDCFLISFYFLLYFLHRVRIY